MEEVKLTNNIKSELTKGKNSYYKNRFTLYKIPYEEWYANNHFRFKVCKRDNAPIVIPEDDVYILKDNSQGYNQQYFIRYPYEDKFVQLYESKTSHAQFSQEFGEEGEYTVGTIYEHSSTRIPYVYYSKHPMFIRNQKICFCGDNGSFSIGCNVFWSDDVIEKFLTNYKFEMLKNNQKIMRTVYNKVSDELMVYTSGDIDYLGEEHLYIINEKEKTYRVCEVKSCEMYRDGGTTIIKYIDNDKEFTLYLDTPFHNPQKHTLNDIPCIESLSEKEYSTIYERFYDIVGIKLLKL